MYRQIRRKDRALPKAEARGLLERGEYGVLGTASAAGLPYTTPLSYIVKGQTIYFHCAPTGQKIENIAAQPRVCFSVVGKTKPVYAGNFTTLYESMVVFGTAHPVLDKTEKTQALMALCQKYLPAHMDKAAGDIAHSMQATAVYAIAIEHITGKAKRP